LEDEAIGSADFSLDARARASAGTSAAAIYRLVANVLRQRHPGGGRLLDVGCGTGNLYPHVQGMVSAYVGVDAVRYEAWPESLAFVQADLDRTPLPLADGSAEVVAAVETMEHLENPRAFVRELVRLTQPGGLILVTTPNNLSLLSKLTLIVKNRFQAFQDVHYPAHLTALLEVDLRRIAAECRLEDVRIHYSNDGRIPGTAWRWPVRLGFRGRAFSDTICLSARTPGSGVTR
jgi:2-polyprenyl-3-methyl-5-hydroxy-6-metoxy-1,4-benzoquinol methylase